MRLILLLFLTFVTCRLDCQEEAFHPLVTNYSYVDYNAGTSNWAVIEDDRGVIYVANREGVLEFDGESWTLIESPQKEVARSFAKDDQGRIYVGFVGDLGYLHPDKTGQIHFLSLKEYIPVAHRMFDEVWRTHFLNGDIYFQTREKLFRWNGSSMDVIDPQNNISGSASINNQLYVGIWNKGLCKLMNDEFTLVPGGEIFANDRLHAILPHDNNSLLIGSNSKGFYISSNNAFIPFPTQIDNQIKGQLYSPCLKLDDGRLVINTLENGVFILDEYGNILTNISERSGLQDDVVDYVYVDSRGTLWMALFNGISTVNLESNFTFLTEELSGLPSKTVNDCIRHQGIFYVGTVNGVYYYDQDKKRFAHVPKSSGQVYQFLKYRNQLFAASNSLGLFEIIDRSIKYIRKNRNNDFQIGMMRISPVDSNRIYAGKRPGLVSLYFDEDSGMLEEESFTDQFQPRYPGFEIDESGNIWTLGRTKGTIEKLVPNIENGKVNLDNAAVIRYSEQTGLPSGITHILNIEGHIDFWGKEIYSYDRTNESFSVRAPFYSKLYKSGAQYFSFPKKDDQGRTWMQAGYGLGVHTDSNIETSTTIFKPFNEIKDIPIWSILVENDSLTNESLAWLSGPSGMALFRGIIEAEDTSSYEILLREIRIGDEDPIYKGSGDLPNDLTLSGGDNTINFKYTAIDYNHKGNIVYQTILDELEEVWSEPSEIAQSSYNNLPSGKYTFRVRAINLYQNESEELVFQFKVQSSIWKKWWMYALYYLLAAIGVILFTKWRTDKLKADQEDLKRIIDERTQEVVDEKNKVEKLFQYQSTLLGEVHHRIKNNLQLIISLLLIQKNKIGDDFDTGVLDMLSNRIKSISLIHEQLYNNTNFETINTKLYAEKLLENYRPLIVQQNAVVDYNVEEIHLNLETITPLGLIWSELISNSLKYNLGKRDLRIHFKLERQGHSFFMHYKDNGRGYAKGHFEGNKAGMGYLIIDSLSRQLFAKTNSFNDGGANFTMNFEEKKISTIK